MKIDSKNGDFGVVSSNQEAAKEIAPKVQKETNKGTDRKDKTEPERKNLPISEKVVIEAIEKANRAIDGARTEFRFSIHKQTHEISVKVIDKDKGEVIREIPPEKVLDMVAKMWEMAGIIVDERR